MKTEVLSYHIQKQKTDFETIKDIISFFSFENVWLIIKGITKEEVEEFNVNMIFSYKNNFYIKLNEKNINDIIKELCIGFILKNQEQKYFMRTL